LDTAFEYISAGIILSMILGVTGVITTNMVSDRMYQIEKTGSFKVADKMIDALLLSTGSPSNWGNSLDSPTSIGLALENGVKPYQLDRNKVKRLNETSVGYIPAHEVRDLLGLSPNYFLKIKIYPIYSITVDEESSNLFTITVINQWGVPVSAVNVTAAYTDIEDVNATEITSLINGDLEDADILSALTDASGQCTLDFTGSGDRTTLIVLAEQLNVKSAIVWPEPSDDLVVVVESSMGDSADFNVEVATRSIEIDGMNYYCKLTLWWS
jgi:hypothetical protein